MRCQRGARPCLDQIETARYAGGPSEPGSRLLATRTRTVVFTDLANYTASVGRADREGLRHLIATHEKLVAPVLEKYGGRIVKNLGDSYMALFRAATDAVRAALELTETIPNEAGFSIRVGMATGDVEVIDGDAFGDCVNLAARIEGKTPEAEVWMSKATLLCMNQAEIAWERVGRFELKGLAGESELFRAVPKDRAWLPEPVRTAAAEGRLVRIKVGDPLPPLPPKATILLEGFAPGSPALRSVVDRLPVVDPASLWLLVHTVAPSDRYAWQQSGHGLVIGLPEPIERALAEAAQPQRSTGSDTIIIDMAGSAEMELVIAGLALPAVPMSEVVAAYTYDLLADGRWVNRSDASVARVEVTPSGVALRALTSGVLLRGRQMRPGQPMTLADGDVVSTPAGQVRYRALRARGYAGLMLSDMLGRLGLAPGQLAEVGREPHYPGLALPDRRGQDNIRWCVGSRAARARQNGFTLDRALAGRRQCAIDLQDGPPKVVSLHQRCPTFLVRGPDLQQVHSPSPVSPGDLVVVGTTVVALREPDA